MGGVPLPREIADVLTRDSRGLVPVVVQEAGTGSVLMLAWMNDQALDVSLRTRRATYWSRSRNELWVKGATSGHTQTVRRVGLDCDGDALLMVVEQTGPACHTGLHSCFDSHLLLADTDGGSAAAAASQEAHPHD